MKKAGLTQAQLADAVGSNQATIQRYLAGRIPRADELLAIAEHFGASVEWLLTGRATTGPHEIRDAPAVERRVESCDRCADLAAELESVRRELAELKAQLKALAK